MKQIALAVLLAATLAVAACGGGEAMPTAELPNPASEFCLEKGGQILLRTASDGSQQGFCLFTDGTVCDEWTFYRGECGPGVQMGGSQIANPASVFCEEKGGKSEIRTEADGSQTGYCKFADGTECEEWAFYRGECAPGTPIP